MDLARGLSAHARERSGSRAKVTIGIDPGRTATRHLRAFLALALAAVVSLLLAATATAQAPATTVLVFHGTPDATVTAGVAAIEALGAANDFEVDTSQNAADFTAANLEQYRAIVFLGNAGDALNAAQESALQGYIQDGGGFVGIGGAAQAEPGSTFFGNLIGARPAAGSPTGTSQQVVAVGDRVHPATRGLPLEWTRQDVWYQWETRPTGQVHTVARYRAPGAPAGDGTNIGGTDWPISWCRDFQGGRSFYTGMGRTAAAFDEADLRTHLLGAIQWSAGMIRGGCKATIAANYAGERLVDGSTGDLDAHRRVARRRARAQRLGVLHRPRRLPHRRAARRDDRHRPAPRILDFANRNVGIGCGNVHIWDPAEHDGTVNSGVTLAGILPVYGDRGGGDEINGKIEAGLLGVTVSPDFAETGHIYLQYFPTFNPDNPVHPGLADGDQRRITKMNKGRVSRFTVDLDTKQLDLDSEVVIFEYESQIYSCCHRGGGMGFDSEGNLYVTTGDSNSSQSTNGYSGNFQPARCPTGPPTEVSNNHCGNNNISFNDARRTAGSTNDYNGKMLRFNPVDTIPDGSQPQIGVNSTYTLPERPVAERPEPLQRHRGQRQPGQAGDLRDGPSQPVAPVHRPRDGHPVLGVGRPRRRLAVGDAGAVDLRERVADAGGRQLRLALLHGQPAGLPRPRRRRLAAHHQRCRLRHRRPGHRAHPGLVRLQQPRQRLDEQHRPDRASAPDRHRQGRGPGAPAEPLVQPRQPGQQQRLPDLPARARSGQRAELRRLETAQPRCAPT